jgi:thiol-disulfide isomerase/thioredoxin
MPRIRPSTLLALVLGVAAVAGGAPAARADDARWEPILAGHALRGAEGETLRLADLKGEVVVVNFWASWCKPCKKELRRLDGWLTAAAPRGGRIVAVSVDRDRRKAERFVAEADLALPVYHDGPDGLARDLDLPSLPLTVVLDREGRVVTTLREADDAALERLLSDVDAMLDAPGTAPREGGRS